jgi:hypothetical protein
VDEYTIDILLGKKGVFEVILGEGYSAGLLGGEEELNLESGMDCGTDEEFKLELLRHAHRRGSSLRKFLLGDNIEAARGDEDYTMVFEKKQGKTGMASNSRWSLAMQEEEPLG